MIGNAIIIRR